MDDRHCMFISVVLFFDMMLKMELDDFISSEVIPLKDQCLLSTNFVQGPLGYVKKSTYGSIFPSNANLNIVFNLFNYH